MPDVDPDERKMRVTAWTLLGVQLALIAAIVLLPVGTAWVLPEVLASIARVVSWAGLAIMAVGLASLGRSLSPLPTPVANGELRTGGLFRVVRHPVYTGLCLWALATAVFAGSIAIAACAVALVAWLGLKARFEERRLVERYPGYVAYMARTPRFIPRMPLRPRT